MLDNVENSSTVLCDTASIHKALQEEELVSQFDKYLQEFEAEKEETCAAVPAKLAPGINNLFSKGIEHEKFKTQMAKIS